MVTTSQPGQLGSVTNCAALHLGKPLRLASRVGTCPTGCGASGSGFCPYLSPLPQGSFSLDCIKGEGFALNPHPFGARFAALRVRLPGQPLTQPAPLNRGDSFPGRSALSVANSRLLNLKA